MRIIAIALVLLLGYVAYSAMQGLTHYECKNPYCECEPCKCGRFDCHCRATVVPVVVEPEPEPTPEPVKPNELRAYVVTACKSPGCKDHGAFARELQRLSNWGTKLRVLAANSPADAVQIKNLNIPCDAFSYVVLTDGFNVYVKPWPKNADEIGNWLLETAKDKRPDCVWGVAGDVEPMPKPQAEAAPAGLYSLAQVSGGESCPPCMAFKRDQRAIEQEIGAPVEVNHINMHNLPLRVTLGKDQTTVESVPTTFLLLDGRIVDRTTGYRGKRHFLSWLAKAEREHGGKWHR